MTRGFLRMYGWLFAASGALFVLAAGPLLAGLDLLAPFLPAARPIPGGEHTLWLGLTGSMMAMISYLSFSLAADPGQDAAWNVLLLSKGTSTALFLLFAALDRNSLFLLGSAVDGAIFLHLLSLRMAPADGLGKIPSFDVWFAKMNDPVSRNALWIRRTALRTRRGVRHQFWYVLFDKERGRTLSGTWDALPPPSPRGLDLFAVDGNGASWDLAWTDAGAPPFAFVPPMPGSTRYETPVSHAVFSGRAAIAGESRRFERAPGCIGHLWGKRLGRSWRWAHAVLGDDAVFELLSARVGPFWLTSANLWFQGRHHRSIAKLHPTARAADVWSFKIDFGEVVAEGSCEPDPALTAELAYTSPDGRRLLCRNSKTGRLSLTVRDRRLGFAATLHAPDSAAVEYASGVSSACAGLILPFAQAYAQHARLPVGPISLQESLERRLSLLAWWARLYMALGAAFMRWAAPALILGRPAKFASLEESGREKLLCRLQASSWPVRALFLGVKSLVLSCCYADPEPADA